MSALDAGGPAFPIAGKGESWDEQGGMSLRDHFAGLAMQGILAGDHMVTHEHGCCAEIAGAAYQVADAMLAERKRGAL